MWFQPIPTNRNSVLPRLPQTAPKINTGQNPQMNLLVCSPEMRTKRTIHDAATLLLTGDDAGVRTYAPHQVQGADIREGGKCRAYADAGAANWRPK